MMMGCASDAARGCGRAAEARQNIFKTLVGTLQRALRAQEAGFVVQRQNEPVDFKKQLGFIRICA
ncbi:hypothetical protein D3C86_1937640 [compost metagenome]